MNTNIPGCIIRYLYQMLCHFANRSQGHGGRRLDRSGSRLLAVLCCVVLYVELQTRPDHRPVVYRAPCIIRIYEGQGINLN